MDAFTYALMNHMETHGLAHSRWGGESIAWHMRDSKCSGWVIPKGSKALPETVYVFNGTDVDMLGIYVVVMDRPVSCACGEYEDQKVYLEGTFSTLLNELLKVKVPNEVTFK